MVVTTSTWYSFYKDFVFCVFFFHHSSLLMTLNTFASLFCFLFSFFPLVAMCLLYMLNCSTCMYVLYYMYVFSKNKRRVMDNTDWEREREWRNMFMYGCMCEVCIENEIFFFLLISSSYFALFRFSFSFFSFHVVLCCVV